MTKADEYYNYIVNDIIENGYNDFDEEVRPRYADGTPAHTLSNMEYTLRFQPEEFPILTTKKVAWKTAIKEILWMWQMKSNNVQELRDMGNKTWNEWELEDGTIGKSYGFQLGKKSIRNPLNPNEKIDQVDYLLHQLKNNPASRRHVVSLWNIDDLDEMSLLPCVWFTQWYVKNNKLHLTVRARSNDIILGNPLNILEYSVLHRMIAQVTGYELGEYVYSIGDAHIYDRHLEGVKKQLASETYEEPTFWINPEIKNFYDFTIDDFKLINYKHGEKINFEIAI